MKGSLKKLLKAVYKKNSISVYDFVQMVERNSGDHRDFYPVIGLIKAGYLGITIPQTEKDNKFWDTITAYTLQCYSQGRGPQAYMGTHLMGEHEEDSNYFYIGPRTIEYFEARDSDKVKLFISTFLSFIAAVTVALISFWLRQ